MGSRIINVYYGEDCLPYKDSERTVHYPITGSSFAGSSNVNELHFYTRDIGGVNNLSWVAIVKLPNGKILYQLLTDYHYDSEINEYYVSFNLSQFYTQLKGDIYISLNGCLGKVEIETDEETNISTIQGEIDSRTVVATGAVKFTINYAPQRPVGYSFDLDQYQTIIQALANKTNIISTFKIVADISTETLTNYEDGQVFYDIATKRFYKKSDESYVDYNFIVSNQASVSIIANPTTNINGRVFVHFTSVLTTIGGASAYQIKYDGENTTEEQAREYMAYMTGSSYLPKYNYDRPANTYFLTPDGQLLKPQYDSTNGLVLFVMPQLALKNYVDENFVPYTGATKNVNLGTRKLIAEHLYKGSESANNELATKGELNSAIDTIKRNSYINVDLATYPTLDSFLASQGEEGYIYLYPIDTGESPTFASGYYQYIWENSQWQDLGTTQIDLSGYVQNTALNVQSLKCAYIGSDKDIYYSVSGSNIIVYIYDNVVIFINGTNLYNSPSQINANNPTTTTLSGGVLEITLTPNSLLVWDTTDNLIKVISSSSITNNQIVLLKVGTAQIISGVLYTKIIEKQFLNELKKYETQFYTSSKNAIIINEKQSSSILYFTYEGTMITRIGGNKDLTVSQLASELGVSLVTSPSGNQNCIEIPEISCLVFNVLLNKYEIVLRTAITKYHIILLANVGGSCVGGIWYEQLYFYKNQYRDMLQIYNGSDYFPYIECDRTNYKVYLSYENDIISRITPNLADLSISQLATQLGVSLVTSPNGHTNCIEIPNVYSLVYNITNGKFKLISRANVSNTDLVIIANLNGKIISGLFKDMIAEYTNDNDPHNFIQTYPKGSVFANLINNSEENDIFLYFTDPHTSDTENRYTKLLGYINKFDTYIPLDFVLCGGDWLNSGDSTADAKYKLGYVSQSMKKNTSRYYQLVGNHDTNYLGVSVLSNEEIANVYNRDNGKNYYSFETKNTKYYCLDTGDETTTMTTYRWEQIDWLANKLLTDDAKHSVICLHIYWTVNNTLTDMSTNLGSLILAYNARTSVTINGNTYNFSGSTGHIEYVISGHTHLDKNDKIGTVPVFSTINAVNLVKYVISFDVCFADYDNRRLHLVRQGSGSNRTFNLDTGDLIE